MSGRGCQHNSGPGHGPGHGPDHGAAAAPRPPPV